MTRKILISIISCLFIFQLANTQQKGEISYHDESVIPEESTSFLPE